MLIFGKYNNGELRITGHENARNYFGDGSSVKNQGFYPFIDFDDDIDALHSIGAHYYNLKNLDSLDTAYYFEYLIPRAKYKVEAAGKSFDKLLVRLAQNRAPVRVAKIKNGFAALGAIKSLRPASVSKRKNLYELNVTMETVIKNDAKIDSNIAIFIDRGRLPSGWSCQPFEHYLERRVAFYFFGDLKDGSLFIDSLASPQDLFVFGDTIYDISMGLPFEELVAYFFPSNISLEEFKFGEGWKYLFGSFAMQSDRSARDMQSMPVCQKNAIIKTSMKCKDFFDNRQPRAKTVLKWRPPFISNFPLELWYSFTFFRCREPPPADCINCFGLPHTYESCRFSDLKNEGVWGRKW
ncbi:MAG: hypothetical protein LBH25_12980 [Fibromonadaceae bacterium]|nr:hypothetical protein [Fibromonadaceae bacterium]